MGIKKKIKLRIREILVYLLIGRYFQLIDKLLCKISRGNYSGWVLGNQLRAFDYGKTKYISKEPLILIGGFPRSGTSLLRAILEQHSDIAGPSIEIFPFQELHDKWRLKEGFKLSDKEIKKLEKYKKDMILYTEKVAQLFKKKNKSKYVLFKHPKYMMFSKKTLKHFPCAKFIHIIRNPKNATMSQKYWLLPKGRKEWPYEWCCRQYVTYINRGRKIKGKSNYIEVKYEDLINKPVETIKKITDFLGLKKMPEKSIINYYKKKNTDKHKDHPGLAKPLDNKRINKWEKKMSLKDKKIFKEKCGRIYKDLGYINF